MATSKGFKLLFFVLLCSSCNAELSSHELRQVEYQVDSEKTSIDISKEASSSGNETPQNIPKGNDIEEPFKKETAHCLGCVINVPVDQPGVIEMAERAVSAMDQIVAAPTIHATPKVLGVQKQVVNGIQYYIQIEVALSDCPASTTSARDQCKPLPDSPTIICEVTFLDQPWNSPKPQLMGNNCTDANSDNDIENYTPDDLLAVERSSGVENTYPAQDGAETTTEDRLEVTTLAADDSSTDEDRNGRRVNVGTGMMKEMDSSETDLINELADIAVRTLNELDVGGSRKEVVDIIDAKKQIVDGLMYHLVLRVGSKSCSDEADCQTEERAAQSICNVQLHRSWAGDTPYKAKVVKSECEEAWEEDREGRQLAANWISQDMYDPEYTDCIKAVLSKAYNIVPKEKVTLTGLLRQDKEPKSTEIVAELKLDSDRWTIPKPGKKDILILRPKVVCNSEPEKAAVKSEKESLPGAPMPVDLTVNNMVVNAIADFALKELDNESNSPNKRMIVNLIVASSDGTGERVTVKMEVIPTDCPKGVPTDNECSPEKGQDSEICTVVVLDRALAHEYELERAECVPSTQIPRPQNGLTGGLEDADRDSPEVQAAVDFAVGELNRLSNSMYKLNAVGVLEAKRQIVSGILYHLKLAVLPTSCKKDEGTGSTCELAADATRQECALKVWSQPWLNKMTLELVQCADTARNKRSAEGETQMSFGGLTPADTNSPGVQDAVEFAVKELDKSSNSMYKQKAVQVIEAHHQVVAGSLYHLKLKLVDTNCKKSDPATANCEPQPNVDGQICSLKVWSRSWLNATELKDVDCAPASAPARSKRSVGEMAIGGGLTPADANSPGVQDAVAFAVKELDKSSNSMYKQKAVEVIEAHHQVVAGSLYHLKLKLVDTNCKKSDPATANCEPQPNVDGQICSLKVWSRPWLNATELKDVDCGAAPAPARSKRSVGEKVAGGIKDADQNSPEVKEAIDLALREVDKGTNSIYKQKVVEVLEAKRQTVAGTLFHLKLKLSDSSCRKSDEASAANCETLPDREGQICTVKVWSRPWLNETTVTDVNCTPNRAKRSVGVNVPGGIKGVDKNSPDVRAAVEFAVREMDKSTNSIYKQKAVEVIEAKHQVVAGSLYHLKVRVVETNCKKNDQASTSCDQQPNVDGQVCSLKVWSRPWLNEMTLSDVECGPSRAKRALEGGNLPGGLSPADANSPEVKAAIDFALTELDKMSNSIYKQIPGEIIEAQQQVVAGVLYHLKFRVVDSSCKKADQSSSDCQRQPNSVGQICSLKVWSQPWLNKMSVSDVNCVPAPTGIVRARRSVQDMSSAHDVNRNSRIVAAASSYAMRQWENTINSAYKHRVAEVVEAKELLVGGEQSAAYQLRFKVEATNCSKSDSVAVEAAACQRVTSEPIHMCIARVWSKPWRNEISLGSIECQPTATESSQESQIGGLKETDVLDPYIQDIAEYSVDEIDKATNTMYAQKVVRVLEARKQVVSGVLVHLKVELVRTACTKTTKDRSNCQALPDQKSQICEVKIWDRPWLNRRKIRDLKCADAHIISSPEQPADAATNLFSAFVDQFNKTYGSEAERLRRFEIFKENLNTIKELQDTERGTATYGPTMFADLTHEEFKRHYLGLRLDKQQENVVPFPRAEIPNIQLPKEFDWRDHNAVTPVKNQGMCGSCWAFSVTGDIEGQYAIKYKKLLSFSEQELVDCDKLDSGCQGGLPDNAYRALEQLGGLELEQDYPYDGRGESCSFNKTLTRVQVHGALNISSNETDMAKWLVQNGPIAIGINANAMQFYMGGVSHPLKFLCSPASLDHGVLIVGFGEHRTTFRKKLLPYWLIKNSWGKFWGEQGYYRVYRGDGSCGVNMMASSAIIE